MTVLGRLLDSRLARPFIGRRRWQTHFEELHRFAIAGMNMGSGADQPSKSGEAVVLASLPLGATVLDVGANAGEYSELALRIVPEVRLFAFEPQEAAAEAWRARIGNRGSLAQYGLGESERAADLYGAAADSGLASITRRVHAGLTWEPIGSIRIRTLDMVAPELGIAHVDLLKIDVEGAELSVLRGARAMLERGLIHRVQFEFGGTAIDARVFLRDLVMELPGFQLNRIVRDGWFPVAYDEAWEIFITTNFLAIHEVATAVD